MIKGTVAGSAVAEFLNPLRPDQLSANAVNASTMIAKATNNSVDRRGQFAPRFLSIGLEYFKAAAMQVPSK
jgi:hypothetical protein